MPRAVSHSRGVPHEPTRDPRRQEQIESARRAKLVAALPPVKYGVPLAPDRPTRWLPIAATEIEILCPVCQIRRLLATEFLIRPSVHGGHVLCFHGLCIHCARYHSIELGAVRESDDREREEGAEGDTDA